MIQYWLTVLRFFVLGCLSVTIIYSLLTASLTGWGFVVWGWPGILATALIVSYPPILHWAIGK